MRRRNKQFKDFKDSRGKPVSERGEWIYGLRPVLEVLRADVRHLYEAVLPPEGHDRKELASIRQSVTERRLPFKSATREELDELCAGGNHQGVALRTGAFPYVSLEQIIHDVAAQQNALVILLDHIMDPQNTGSILRSANAAGVTAVILPEDRSAGVTPAAVRASAGASEYMRVARVVNLTRAMKQLQDAGLWITALDVGKESRNYTEIDYKGRVGLVVGSEGRGVSRLVREKSDFIASLPMSGKIASLNAGVAAAVAMYEVLRQRETH